VGALSKDALWGTDFWDNPCAGIPKEGEEWFAPNCRCDCLDPVSGCKICEAEWYDLPGVRPHDAPPGKFPYIWDYSYRMYLGPKKNAKPEEAQYEIPVYFQLPTELAG